MTSTPTTTIAKAARQILGGGALACVLFGASSAQAALNFTYDFQGDFVGNAVAQQAIVTAGNQFSTLFGTHFSNTATLNLAINSENTGLAEAYSAIEVAQGFGTGEVVLNKIVNGVDSNGAQADGGININLATNFQLDPNAPVDFANGQIDFYSVIDHEMTHALGFGSGGTGYLPDLHSKFDSFLTDKSGTPLFDSSTALINQTAYDNANANGAFFNGPNAIAAWGSPVPIEGVAGGLSHLDTTTFSSGPGGSVPQNALMLCCGGANVQFEPRAWNKAEVGILTDLGYKAVAAVPEPSTYLMALLGLGFIGVGLKRRKG